MPISLVRVDDRLIHGQVVTTWVSQFDIEQILIINDEIAQDDVQKKVFAMTVPEGIKLRTFGVEQFVGIAAKNPIKRRTLIILTNPIDALTLYKGNVHFEKLNLGGMKFKGDRKQYTKAISLTDEEKSAVKALGEDGVDVSVQMVPSDKKISWQELIKMEVK